MNYRRYSKNLIIAQELLRKNLIKCLFEFDLSKIPSILLKENEIRSLIVGLKDKTLGTHDEIFFKNYSFLIESIFHLLKWGNKELNALPGSDAHLKASKANVNQIELKFLNHSNGFINSVSELILLINNVSDVKHINSILQKIIQIPFPIVYAFEVDPISEIRGFNNHDNNKQDDVEEIALLLSIQLNIDGDPWANPQILKPKEIYIIKGTLTLNYWPEGFDTLILEPATTSIQDWFSISLPEITYHNKLNYNIQGQIVFKYAQNSFDESISIRLFAYFKNDSGYKYPTLIGYDQLIAKVLDPSSTYFLTGFKKSNQIVTNLEIEIQKQLPKIDVEEKNNFLKLLSGFLNYQGYCLQQGIYKEISEIGEDTFRDKLIQHLIGLSYLGEDIIKEQHLAGGRVEISYKGIIAELKVEKNTSNRDELIKKYGKQPTAYASGNSKQLSVLCILDLTKKDKPSGIPQNNIKLIPTEVHGFENDELDFPSKQVLVIIDGNTKKPSDYSK